MGEPEARGPEDLVFVVVVAVPIFLVELGVEIGGGLVEVFHELDANLRTRR